MRLKGAVKRRMKEIVALLLLTESIRQKRPISRDLSMQKPIKEIYADLVDRKYLMSRCPQNSLSLPQMNMQPVSPAHLI